MNAENGRSFKKIATLALAAGVLAAPGLACAEEANSAILGTWRLLRYDVEEQATGKIGPVMGEHPTGAVAFTPNGRVFFMLTGEGRKPATTDGEKAALLDTIVSYTGTAEIKGDQWTTNVEAAWNPKWVGTAQTRNFKIEGRRLLVTTPWRVMPNWADKGMTRSLITFERID